MAGFKIGDDFMDHASDFNKNITNNILRLVSDS